MYKRCCDKNFCAGFELCVIWYERAEMQTVSVVVWFSILLPTLNVTEVNCIKD